MEDEEVKQYKKYVYISTKVIDDLEIIAREKKIPQSLRVIREMNLYELIQSGFKNLNAVSYMFLDLNALTRLTKEKDFVDAIRYVRTLYPTLRIIIIACGTKPRKRFASENFLTKESIT